MNILDVFEKLASICPTEPTVINITKRGNVVGICWAFSNDENEGTLFFKERYSTEKLKTIVDLDAILEKKKYEMERFIKPKRHLKIVR